MTLLHFTLMLDSRPRAGRNCRRRRYLPLLALLLAVPIVACDAAVGLDPEKVRVEVEAALEVYLPQLAAAYARQDPAELSEVTVAKEMAHIELRVDELADRGERLVSNLQQFSLDKVEVARATAYVATTEIWDIERRALGSDRLIESYPSTRYQVRYQLRLDSGRWLVVFRQLIDSPQV